MRLPNQQKHHYGAKRDTWADVERESSDIKLESTVLPLGSIGAKLDTERSPVPLVLYSCSEGTRGAALGRR